MNTDQIVKEAKARLTEIEADRLRLEAEAVKLRAIIAAAEGKTAAPLPAPNPLPFIPVMPQPYPYPAHVPTVPWPLDRVTCRDTVEFVQPEIGSLTIEATPNVLVTNGVRRDRHFVIGGPQRMDPNVRFVQ
jgi:hypothetical protein